MTNSATSNCDFVTVVTGLPRSGTSMMMQMLAAGGIPPLTDQLRNADADNTRGYFELEKVKAIARDSSWLADAQGLAVKIVAPLLAHLPAGSYRMIFMQRDMQEILQSQAAMLARTGKAGGRITIDELANVFERQLQAAADFVTSAGYPALHVNYRRCISQPSEVAEELDRFLAIRLDVAAMTTVVDAALYRQRA